MSIWGTYSRTKVYKSWPLNHHNVSFETFQRPQGVKHSNVSCDLMNCWHKTKKTTDRLHQTACAAVTQWAGVFSQQRGHCERHRPLWSWIGNWHAGARTGPPAVPITVAVPRGNHWLLLYLPILQLHDCHHNWYFSRYLVSPGPTVDRGQTGIELFMRVWAL